MHVPVMLAEVLDCLALRRGGTYLDGTLGSGGYAIAIARQIGPAGTVLGLDRDPAALERAAAAATAAGITIITPIHESFTHITDVCRDHLPPESPGLAGVVLDLGLSSDQLADESRGFSFQLDAPLDMAFGPDAAARTMTIVNRWPVEDLERVIRDFGEERYARRIAERIAAARQSGMIERTLPLVAAIAAAVPAAYRNDRRLHFATRTFQALRIATNAELEALQAALPQALDVLAPGGRLVVVSYHSLEDRIVKRFFRHEAAGCLCLPQAPVCTCGHEPRLAILTKRPLTASSAEIAANPRARSAKLRAAGKIGNNVTPASGPVTAQPDTKKRRRRDA